jgi:hypothetical protein
MVEPSFGIPRACTPKAYARMDHEAHSIIQRYVASTRDALLWTSTEFLKNSGILRRNNILQIISKRRKPSEVRRRCCSSKEYRELVR